MEWFPIETAPKKFIKVDDWTNEKVINFELESTNILVTDGNKVWEDFWHLMYDTNDLALGWGNWGSVPDAGEPTHWMPLPEPPRP